MRIIHTSDWHIGKRLNQQSLTSSHEMFFDWLVDDVLTNQKPDLLVVSGDIYDRAVPPTDAIELFEDTLARIRSLGVKTLITSGNHDSRVRLGTNTRFMESSGLFFRTRLNQVDKPLVIEGEDFDLLAYGIPYIEPDVDTGDAEHQWKVPATQSDVLLEAMRRINLDVALRQKNTSKPLKVLVGSHAFIVGAVKSDSERNIKVGTLGEARSDVFAGADYVAMGHLHGSKHGIKAPDGSVLRYSGSPIPFSFSERDHLKQVLGVDINANGIKEEGIESHEVPQIRKMKQFEGTLEDLLGRKFEGTDDWVKVVILDPKVEKDVFDTLKRKFPNLLELDFKRNSIGDQNSIAFAGQLRELSPEEVTRRFVQRVTEKEPSAEVETAIDDCCTTVKIENSAVNK
jgi:exonuclease SbcD